MVFPSQLGCHEMQVLVLWHLCFPMGFISSYLVGLERRSFGVLGRHGWEAARNLQFSIQGFFCWSPRWRRSAIHLTTSASFGPRRLYAS